MTLNDQVKNAIDLLESGELSGKAAHIAGLLKLLQRENKKQKEMLQNHLRIITRPSSENECKLEARVESLSEALEEAVGIMVTCQADNKTEWMLGLQDDINEWAELLGDCDRVEYLKDRRRFKIIKGKV